MNNPRHNTDPTYTGILLVNKPSGEPSFNLVRQLRRMTQERCIGHAGTLDPFACGVMVMLIGRAYTRLANRFLNQDKEYLATICLGQDTDTYDLTGKVTAQSDQKPTQTQIEAALQHFQGWVSQTPPMYSAKKIQGKRLYELARKGQVIERQSIQVHMQLDLLAFESPLLTLRVACSKGTYIRSLAHDLGKSLGCYGHLVALQRSRSGAFHLQQCIDGNLLRDGALDIRSYLIRQVA